MKVRKLENKDAVTMLEWMHEEDIIKYLHTDFMHKTLEDCFEFIKTSSDESDNIHYAIVDDMDNYMGTVSLKNVSNDSAEFAIVLHSKAIGKGYSRFAIHKIIEIAKKKFKLKEVYWCVDKNNQRAIRFYEKNGYNKVDVKFIDKYVKNVYDKEKIYDMIWYLVLL